MAKSKTDEELLKELELFHHHESAKRFRQLLKENKELRGDSRRLQETTSP